MKTFLHSLMLVSLVFLFSGAHSIEKWDQADVLTGKWLTQNGKAHIEIYKNNQWYEGRIVWLKEPLDPVTGKPKKDIKNENKNNRSRPVLGLQNLRGFTYAGDNIWEDGKIYNPEDGKEYKCKITLTDAHTIEVRGFVGISLIGKTQVWKRIR